MLRLAFHFILSLYLFNTQWNWQKKNYSQKFASNTGGEVRRCQRFSGLQNQSTKSTGISTGDASTQTSPVSTLPALNAACHFLDDIVTQGFCGVWLSKCTCDVPNAQWEGIFVLRRFIAANLPFPVQTPVSILIPPLILLQVEYIFCVF